MVVELELSIIVVIVCGVVESVVAVGTVSVVVVVVCGVVVSVA